MIAVSCDLNPDDAPSEEFTYGFEKNKEIVTDTFQPPEREDNAETLLKFSVVPGDSLVFRYERNIIPPENVMDGGFYETIVFQAPPGTDRFELSGRELERADVFYRRGCFCPAIGALNVTEGFIRGRKLSEAIWFIKASVSAESGRQTFDIEFDHVFYLK